MSDDNRKNNDQIESLKTAMARLLMDACCEPAKPENAELLRYFVTLGLTANAFLRQSSTGSLN